MTWPYDNLNGSEPNLTLLLGEVVANTRNTMLHVQAIHQRLDHLSEENIRRQGEHAAVQVRLDQLEPSRRNLGLFVTTLPDLMDTAGQFLKAMATVREWVAWLLSSTLAYKVITSPVEIKQYVLWILGMPR